MWQEMYQKLHQINRSSFWYVQKKKSPVLFAFFFLIIRCQVVVGQQEACQSLVHTDRRVWLRWPPPQWGARGGSSSCAEPLLSAGMTAGGPQCLLSSASLKPGLDLQAVVLQLMGEDCNHPGRPAGDSWCTELTVYLKQEQLSLRVCADHQKVIS